MAEIQQNQNSPSPMSSGSAPAKSRGVWVAVIVVLVIVIAAGAYFYYQSRSESGVMIESDVMMMEDGDRMKMAEMGPREDAMRKEVDEAMMTELKTQSVQFVGNLADVTQGQTIRGINTGGNARGRAGSNFTAGTYSLIATFAGIPHPTGSDFYEGWIVRRGDNFDVISTGRVELVEGVYTNVYSSGEDLTDHDFYVLTIEPADGNPAPADHIVEGVMTAQ